MAKFKIESQITLLAVIIAAAVITSGYFAWKSLSEIVSSIHEEARPDNKLFLIKDIANDLSAIENNARLFVLAKNRNSLNSYDSLQSEITGKLSSLYEITPPESSGRALIDSFRIFAISKVKIWNSVLNLHQGSQGSEDEFNRIYNQLEEQSFDTITTVTEKKGLLRRIFGKPKIITDTTIVENELQKDQLLEQLQEMQNEISEEDEQVDLLESDLIAQNMVVTNKINRLIAHAETQEVQSLMEETAEADRLAKLTFVRLAGFSIMAVLLLLLVVFLLSNYLSKRRKYERGLQKARRQAEELARAKEQFAANVSHEMRTPVNAIYGLAEQLLRRKDNENLDGQISVLAQSASHLHQVINDTLDFTKIQAGKIRFEEEHFSPKEVLQEIFALQKFSAMQKNIMLDLKLAGNLPEALLGDSLRLKQIVINLVGNAIKFTEKGQVVLAAKTLEKTGNRQTIKIEVSDTGIGISKQDQKVIFDEFVQAENAEGKKYRGTGLGLSIVKKLVELLQGSISINSEPGVGTTITVILAYKHGDQNKIQPQQKGLVEVPLSFKQIRILIADDEEFNRFLFRAIFDKWNIQYTEATNGEEAVKLALENDFDIVMMDMRMPKKDGLVATNEILGVKPKTKIIAITATTDEAEKEKCRQAGMVGFLPKPFSEEQLFSVIHSTVNINEKKDTEGHDYLAEMKKMANGDEVFLKEMLALFIQSTHAGLSQIEDALKQNDWERIAENAHKIAPQVKHLRDQNLYKKVKALENGASKQPVNKEAAAVLFNELKNKIDTINKQFEKFIEQNK